MIEYTTVPRYLFKKSLKQKKVAQEQDRRFLYVCSCRFLVEENVEQGDEEGNALEEENENKQASELGTENEN